MQDARLARGADGRETRVRRQDGRTSDDFWPQREANTRAPRTRRPKGSGSKPNLAGDISVRVRLADRGGAGAAQPSRVPPLPREPGTAPPSRRAPRSTTSTPPASASPRADHDAWPAGLVGQPQRHLHPQLRLHPRLSHAVPLASSRREWPARPQNTCASFGARTLVQRAASTSNVSPPIAPRSIWARCHNA